MVVEAWVALCLSIILAGVLVVGGLRLFVRADARLAEEDRTVWPIVPEPSVCPDCEGEGWVVVRIRGYDVEVPCDECGHCYEGVSDV